MLIIITLVGNLLSLHFVMKWLDILQVHTVAWHHWSWVTLRAAISSIPSMQVCFSFHSGWNYHPSKGNRMHSNLIDLFSLPKGMSFGSVIREALHSAKCVGVEQLFWCQYKYCNKYTVYIWAPIFIYIYGLQFLLIKIPVLLLSFYWFG